jgi:hypothetical protein
MVNLRIDKFGLQLQQVDVASPSPTERKSAGRRTCDKPSFLLSVKRLINHRLHHWILHTSLEGKMKPIPLQSRSATLRNRPMQSVSRRRSTLPSSRATTWFNSCCVRPAAVAFATPCCCGNCFSPRRSRLTRSAAGAGHDGAVGAGSRAAAPRQRLRLLSSDSETNRALKLFPLRL